MFKSQNLQERGHNKPIIAIIEISKNKKKKKAEERGFLPTSTQQLPRTQTLDQTNKKAHTHACR